MGIGNWFKGLRRGVSDKPALPAKNVIQTGLERLKAMTTSGEPVTVESLEEVFGQIAKGDQEMGIKLQALLDSIVPAAATQLMANKRAILENERMIREMDSGEFLVAGVRERVEVLRGKLVVAQELLKVATLVTAVKVRALMEIKNRYDDYLETKRGKMAVLDARVDEFRRLAAFERFVGEAEVKAGNAIDFVDGMDAQVGALSPDVLKIARQLTEDIERVVLELSLAVEDESHLLELGDCSAGSDELETIVGALGKWDIGVADMEIIPDNALPIIEDTTRLLKPHAPDMIIDQDQPLSDFLVQVKDSSMSREAKTNAVIRFIKDRNIILTEEFSEILGHYYGVNQVIMAILERPVLDKEVLRKIIYDSRTFSVLEKAFMHPSADMSIYRLMLGGDIVRLLFKDNHVSSSVGGFVLARIKDNPKSFKDSLFQIIAPNFNKYEDAYLDKRYCDTLVSYVRSAQNLDPEMAFDIDDLLRTSYTNGHLFSRYKELALTYFSRSDVPDQTILRILNLTGMRVVLRKQVDSSRDMYDFLYAVYQRRGRGLFEINTDHIEILVK